jgi:hypothetical protein
MTLHLVTCVRQADGSTRYLLVTNERAAREWAHEIRHDPAMLDGGSADYLVDDEDGRLVAYGWPGPAGRRLTHEEWRAIRAAIRGGTA